MYEQPTDNKEHKMKCRDVLCCGAMLCVVSVNARRKYLCGNTVKLIKIQFAYVLLLNWQRVFISRFMISKLIFSFIIFKSKTKTKNDYCKRRIQVIFEGLVKILIFGKMATYQNKSRFLCKKLHFTLA